MAAPEWRRGWNPSLPPWDRAAFRRTVSWMLCSRVWARWDQEERRLAGNWREQGAHIGLEPTIDLKDPKILKTQN